MEPLVLTEEQELLAKTASDFAAQHSPLSRVRALRDAGDPVGFSRPLWRQMAELGWVGIPFPEAVGGAGLGLAELAVVLEALGRSLAPEPFVSSVLLAGQALALGGSPAQHAAWLPGVVGGETLLALAHEEPGLGRYAPHRVATRAEPDGSGWRLRGEKCHVLDGHAADALVVVARTAGDVAASDGIGLFIVPARSPGLSAERLQRIDGRNAARVRLADVSVPADAVLGAPGAGAALLDRVLDRATAGLCAEMLGGLSQALAATLDHLKTRRQFGVPIGSFQALQHRAVDVFIEIELCRSAVMAAARALDAGQSDAPLLVSLAKARCSEGYLLAANEAVQMFGGVGMTDEYDIGFHLKRARVAEQSLGDAAWHRERWARLSDY